MINVQITIQSVTPKLLRAIGRLEVWTAFLKAAVNESNSSAATCQAQQTGNVTEEMKMGQADLSDEIQAVEKTIGVVQSATALISGFQARLDAAVAAALENGATAEQLQPLSDLSVVLGTSADELAAAVAANTPATPES